MYGFDSIDSVIVRLKKRYFIYCYGTTNQEKPKVS